MPAPALTTQAVLDRHAAAFGTGSVQTILADYAPDAVMLTPDGLFRGHAQIGPVLQRVLDEVFSTCTDFKMLQKIVEGEVAYIVWSAQAAKVNVPLGTDTFIIRGGKIVVQTFAAKVEPKV